MLLSFTPESGKTCSFILSLFLFFSAPVSAQVANLSGEDSTIFISGTIFMPKYSYQAGEQNWANAVADMNKDGHPDVVSAAKLDGSIHINYNDGTGKFTRHLSFKSQPQNRALAIGDFNRDGYADVAAVTILGRLWIGLNDRKGNLTTHQVLPTGVMAHDICIGDLNGDEIPDLAVASVSQGNINIHWGNNSGKFANPVLVKTGPKPRSVRTGDINGDNIPDLVVGCDDGRVYIHVNSGKGNFARTQSIRSGAANWGLELADLNQDGHLDIASASYLDKKLCIHLNNGDGTFMREQEVISGDHNFDMVIRDFDMDGDLDIVTCSTVDKAISFHLNQGAGVFGDRVEMKSGDWNAGIDAADFDGDGDMDIVTASINDHNINIHRNTTADEEPEIGKSACLTGKVYDQETGKILPRVPITLQNKEGESIETSLTAADGSYKFCPKTNRSYLLTVRAPGFPVHQEGTDFGETNQTKDLYLAKPKGAFVYGKIRDRETQKPLPNATVKLSNSLGEAIITLKADDKGNYRQELPFDRNYEVGANYPRYRDEFKYFDLDESHHPAGLRVNIELETKIPANHACLHGTVYDDKTGEVVASAGIVVRDVAGNVVKKFRVNDQGEYDICLPYGEYQFSTIAKGYFFNVSETFVDDEESETIKEHDIYLLPLEKGVRIVLENIYYDVDKATLRPESIEELERLLQIMNQNPGLKVEISGHTDSDASEAYNKTLSENRAYSVVEYLVNAGIEDSRMEAKGYGEILPIAPNDTPENKQLNRRTEFKVIGFEEGS